LISRTGYSKALSRAVQIALCVVVFLFAFHAKTAAYTGSASVKVTPTTSSKLWLNGQKMEVRSVQASSNVLFAMTLLCLVGLSIKRETPVEAVVVTPLRSNLRHIQRFFRPPPVHA
jgi:hypothetical protein